jgi:hypothetical protein
MTLEQDKIFDEKFERKIQKKVRDFTMLKTTCEFMNKNHKEFLNKSFGILL